MTTQTQVLSADPITGSRLAGSLPNKISSIGQWIATWAETCADYYAAAAMYEQPSVLSDAELTRRGLSRATLAHDVRAACDRGSKP
jgi:hypothetical protein